MRRSRLVTLAALAAVAAGFLALTGPDAQAADRRGQHHYGHSRIPAHVFAPYFEAWTGDSPAAVAKQSGDKYLTMAFVQTAAPGSCTALWNGDVALPIAASSFGADIAAIRASGGDVIPSFGGYSADNGGTEIADSCASVDAIAAQFVKLITTYGVTRIDLDIEDNSLSNVAGIDRRNKAVKKTEDWAAAHGRAIQFVYTLPTTTHGLEPDALAVLQNAVTNKARIDVVNLMTFDYYDELPHQMAADTKTAAAGLVGQLAILHPRTTTGQLWAMVGITEMIGVDDFGPAETFARADAPIVERWAARQGIAMLSFWAVQRDNGSCPGGAADDACSGVAQSTWQFSKTFQRFTSGRR
jgi:chitinase